MKKFMLKGLLALMLTLVVNSSFAQSLNVYNNTNTSIKRGEKLNFSVSGFPTVHPAKLMHVFYGTTPNFVPNYQTNHLGNVAEYGSYFSSDYPFLSDFYIPCDAPTTIYFKGRFSNSNGSVELEVTVPVTTVSGSAGNATTLPGITAISDQPSLAPCDGSPVLISTSSSSFSSRRASITNLIWGTTYVYGELETSDIANEYGVEITNRNADGQKFVKVKGCPAKSNYVTVLHRPIAPQATSLTSYVGCAPRKLTIANASSNSSISYVFESGGPVFNSPVTATGSTSYSYNIPNTNPGESYYFLVTQRRTGYCDSEEHIMYYTVPAICGARKSVVNAEDVNAEEINAIIISNQNTQTIDIKLPGDELSYVSILNMQGQVVKSLEMNMAEANISVSDLNEGIYLVDVKQNGQSFNNKVHIVK